MNEAHSTMVAMFIAMKSRVVEKQWEWGSNEMTRQSSPCIVDTRS